MRTQLNRNRRIGVISVMLVAAALLLLPEPALSVAIFPASAKEGGICLGFPDVCWVPLLPVPVPLPSAAPMSAAKKAANKVKIQQKKTETKKPSTQDVKEANAWLTRIEASAKTYEKQLLTSMASKSQKAAARAVLKKVLALVAEGRAATKDPRSAGEMYTKLFDLHTELMSINYPTLLRQPLPKKKK